MCQTTLTRSAVILVTLQDGQPSYTFNVTTFRNKTITKIEVQDSTGLGLSNAPNGATLAATSLTTQAYINLVSAINTTDNIVQTYPAGRFMPSTGTAIGAGLTNFNQIELSGVMNLDMQNSSIVFPVASALTGVSGQVILINVWYDDRDPMILYNDYLKETTTNR